MRILGFLLEVFRHDKILELSVSLLLNSFRTKDLEI